MDTPDHTPVTWPPITLLTGHLAPASLAVYAHAVHAYRRFCGSAAQALEATSLARWRTTLASSGCRVSEVVALTTPQIVARRGRFVVQVLGKNQTAPREAPLSQEAFIPMEEGTGDHTPSKRLRGPLAVPAP